MIKERWNELYAAWLMQAAQRGGNTFRAYQQATRDWLAFLRDVRQVDPWAATSKHAVHWRITMQGKLLAPATINQRLNICSSLYGYVLDQLPDHSEESNPFMSDKVERVPPAPRPREAQYLLSDETEELLISLERRRNTLTGSRNYALILGYLFTGYRNMEFVSLQWGAIRPHRQQPGAWVIERQVNKKRIVDPLPGLVYEAIVNYLRIAGRDTRKMRPEEYIFKPLLTHNQHNLKHAPAQPSAHLSTKQVDTIVKLAMRRAGIRPRSRRVQSLRYTFAQRYYSNKKDLAALSQRLHLKSPLSTSRYAREVFPDDPVDDFSQKLYR